MKQLFIFIDLFTACANAAQAQEVCGHEEKADISALHSGYYLVFVALNGKQYCKKIVRQ